MNTLALIDFLPTYYKQEIIASLEEKFKGKKNEDTQFGIDILLLASEFNVESNIEPSVDLPEMLREVSKETGVYIIRKIETIITHHFKDETYDMGDEIELLFGLYDSIPLPDDFVPQYKKIEDDRDPCDFSVGSGRYK